MGRQLAVFEAVNAVTGEYQPYLGTIEAPAGASPEAAAIAASYRVLINYFPANPAPLDAARESALAAIPDGQEKDDGIATGEAAAGNDPAARQRRLGARPVLRARPSGAGRMGGHAQLPDRQWSSGRSLSPVA
jgi:hypothetical protein